MSRPPANETLRLPLGRAGREGPSTPWTLLALGLVLVAIGVAAFPGPEGPRAALAAALVALAAALHHRGGARSNPPRGWLLVDDTGVRRAQGDGTSALLRWDEPFGVTLFASADRATLLIAFTSLQATRFVPAYRGRDDAPAHRARFDRAATTADSDLPAGEEPALSAGDADALLTEVARRAPAALDRVYLSDAGGEPLTLDRAELRVGSKRIDLSAPLEWRAFLFQERGVQAASVCQATWVRQGDVEVVLVAAMPGDSGWLGAAAPTPGAEDRLPRDARQALARDMRLMQATAGDPPPRELRRAIDRVFMLPLRRALDAAPRLVKARATFEPLSGSRSST
jgi:hypothetical protein